ncbi:hypothetical protein ABW19_dt0210534 [Dactylella cylindrospora]|nr:hypothetical protein ABW19_dt0210534 [Dactylella cylindrospora]
MNQPFESYPNLPLLVPSLTPLFELVVIPGIEPSTFFSSNVVPLFWIPFESSITNTLFVCYRASRHLHRQGQNCNPKSVYLVVNSDRTVSHFVSRYMAINESLS